MPAYKDNERNTWYCSFYYTDWTGARKKHHKRGFSRKKDAEAYEREYILKRTQSPTMTFQSLYELYMEDMGTRLKENTMETKRWIFDEKVLPYFGNLQVDKITAATIRTWQNDLLKKGYRQTYVRTIHNQLSAIFNYAVKYYNLHENPCRVAGAIGKKKTDEEMLFWTVNEFNAALQGVKRYEARVAISILFWTGLRVGELLALQEDDFDFQNLRLRVNKSFQRINDEDVITEPKTARSKRTIDITQALADTVQEYIKALYDYQPGQRLFPVTKKYISYQIDAACKATGVKRIRVHDLRHSHAAMLISLGTDILLVSERLGHENVETTLNVYAHLYPSHRSETTDKMEKISFVVPK